MIISLLNVSRGLSLNHDRAIKTCFYPGRDIMTILTTGGENVNLFNCYNSQIGEFSVTPFIVKHCYILVIMHIFSSSERFPV